jgi:hypothetical protein
MFPFKRIHDGGTEAILKPGADGWSIQINLKEPNRDPMPIVGYQRRTLESAKQFADKEILKYGHVCNEKCQGWQEFFSG